jgi:hypothetical protein
LSGNKYLDSVNKWTSPNSSVQACSGTYQSGAGCSKSYDNNWSSYAQAEDGIPCTCNTHRAYIYENYTIEGDYGIFYHKSDWFSTCYDFATFFWNYSSSSWESWGSVTDKTIELYEENSSFLSSSPLQFRYQFKADCNNAYVPKLYETQINWTNYSYPANASIYVNNTSIWSFVNEFNHTNNKTNDFASTLNTALNSGTCDCVGCSLVGDNCVIPFNFSSDTAGRFEYFDVDINWLEYINPNLTINAPNQTYTAITNVPLNITTEENHEFDYCYFNITRGASTEVANTEILDCNYTTFTVSGDANYIAYVYINDSSGNANYSSASFTIDDYVPPAGSSGGGGGFIERIIEAITPEIRADSVCNPFDETFSEVFDKFWSSASFDNFVIFIRSLWDSITCRGASSIVSFSDLPE